MLLNLFYLHFLSGGWTITGTPLDLRDPRLLAMAEAERHFLEAEYDEYAATNASGAAFCRSAALIVSIYQSHNLCSIMSRSAGVSCMNPLFPFSSIEFVSLLSKQ